MQAKDEQRLVIQTRAPDARGCGCDMAIAFDLEQCVQCVNTALE
jgi:hypothetical protein